MQLHVRNRRQFEEAIAAIGTQVRSGYVLSYYPDAAEYGYHTVTIEVNVPGAKTYSRPGYLMGKD
jgi:hypothetical protein